MDPHQNRETPPREESLSLRLPKWIIRSLLQRKEAEERVGSHAPLVKLKLVSNKVRHDKGGSSKKGNTPSLHFIDFTSSKTNVKEVPLMEEMVDIDYYRRDESNGSIVHENEKLLLKHHRRTMIRYRVATNMTQFGERARALKERELQKRKEIVRLDDQMHLKKGTKRIRQKQGMICKQNPSDEKRRRGTSLKAVQRNARAKKSLQNSISQLNYEDDGVVRDSWAPTLVNDGRSVIGDSNGSGDVVRIYGVPKGCRIQNVKKLFSGLDVKKVFSCIPLPNLTLGLNDEEDYKRKKNLNGILRETVNFRVFAKFSSADIASLACARSGEMISIKHGEQLSFAAVRVEPVSMVVSNFIEKYMVIDLPPLETINFTVSKSSRSISSNVMETFVSFFVSNSEQMPANPSRLTKLVVLANRMSTYLPTTESEDRFHKVYNSIYEHHNSLLGESQPDNRFLINAANLVDDLQQGLIRCRRVFRQMKLLSADNMHDATQLKEV